MKICMLVSISQDYNEFKIFKDFIFIVSVSFLISHSKDNTQDNFFFTFLHSNNKELCNANLNYHLNSGGL